MALLLNSVWVYACECNRRGVVELWMEADFIAKVTVIKTTPDPEDPDQHFMEIEILDHFKGEPITELVVYSILNSSCGFLPRENSDWIIVAYKNKKGELGLGNCTGARAIEPYFQSPKAIENYNESIARWFEVLTFLRDNQIDTSNEYGLAVHLDKYLQLDLKDREVINERFALYRLTIGENLKVSEVEVLKSFNTPEVDKILEQDLKDFTSIYRRSKADLVPANTQILFALFYYPPEDGYLSFISENDL